MKEKKVLIWLIVMIIAFIGIGTIFKLKSGSEYTEIDDVILEGDLTVTGNLFGQNTQSNVSNPADSLASFMINNFVLLGVVAIVFGAIVPPILRITRM